MLSLKNIVRATHFYCDLRQDNHKMLYQEIYGYVLDQKTEKRKMIK